MPNNRCSKAGTSTCTPDRAPDTRVTRRRRPVDGRGPSASTTRVTTPLPLPPHTHGFSLTQSSRVHEPARLTPGELFTPRARLRLAPRPTYSTVAQSGTWLGLGLGLGLVSARARARVDRLGLGLARARVGTSQCMPRRHAAAREPLSRTDGLERAQALIGLLLARVSKSECKHRCVTREPTLLFLRTCLPGPSAG